MLTLIIFIVVLSVIVFIHEMGHFYSAIKLGVKVDEFGLGLPPRLFGVRKVDGKFKFIWGKKNVDDGGSTIYSLNWLPIGGFVKIKGEGGEEADSPDSFASKAIWKKMVILSAGVIMNVVLTIVLLSIGFGLGMPAVVDENTDGALLSDINIQIIQLVESGEAKSAGLEIGDIIVDINGQTFDSISDLNKYLLSNENVEVIVSVDRQGDQLSKDVFIGKYVAEDGQEIVGMGIGLIETAIVQYPWYLAIWKGMVATFVWMMAIIVAFASIIKNLIVGAPTGVEVAGPVGIAVLTGQAAQMGFVYLLQFTALLSLNLAIINIMPFPALDGGRLLFLAIEKIRGKAVKQELENLIHNIGFLLLMVLVLLVTFGDIFKYGGGFFGAVKGLIGL